MKVTTAWQNYKAHDGRVEWIGRQGAGRTPGISSLMNVQPTRLPGVLVLEPRVFRDLRGSFVETWNATRYAAAGLGAAFKPFGLAWTSWKFRQRRDQEWTNGSTTLFRR